jgi:hypothetical protein
MFGEHIERESALKIHRESAEHVSAHSLDDVGHACEPCSNLLISTVRVGDIPVPVIGPVEGIGTAAVSICVTLKITSVFSSLLARSRALTGAAKAVGSNVRPETLAG